MINISELNRDLSQKELDKINGGWWSQIARYVGPRLVGGFIGGKSAEKFGFGGRVSDGTLDYARQQGLIPN